MTDQNEAGTGLEKAPPGQLTKEDAEMLGMDRWLSPAALQQQLTHVREIISTVLEEDIDYGTLPGTEKPMLYQPGAQTLALAFNMRPEFSTTSHDLPGEHRNYEVKCILLNKRTGMIMGEGVGSCSTMESKYRYRNADPIPTDQPVPHEFWNLRRANRMKEAVDLLGGKDFTFKKIEGRWLICKKTGDKVLNENPADYYNTCLKIAAKRAKTAAVIDATAAGAVLMAPPEEVEEDEEATGKKTGAGRKNPAATKTEQKKEKQPQDGGQGQKKASAPIDERGLSNKDQAAKLKGDYPDIYEKARQAAEIPGDPESEASATLLMQKARDIWKKAQLEFPQGKTVMQRAEEIKKDHPQEYKKACDKFGFVMPTDEKGLAMVKAEVDATPPKA